MKKICILTDKKMFLDVRASGLRLISVNIYFALKKLGYEVDFISSNFHSMHYYSYEKLIFDEELVKKNFFVQDIKVNIKSFIFPFILPRRRGLKVEFRTEAIDINSYDVIFTSFEEWDKVVNYNLKKSIQIFNIYHDKIREIYRFTKSFNYKKASDSYAVWTKNMLYSNKILCVSEDVKHQFKDCFEKHEYFDEKKLALLPAAILPSFCENTPSYEAREDSLVIGNIFDERKEPLDAVKIINQMKQIKKLYIYGAPRCQKSLIRKIFNTLRKDIEIEYFMQISNKTLIDILSKSKALLFPSSFEGLGLPIIEAQMLGCPVMVRDKPPMNSLLMAGSVLMSEDFDENAKILDDLFLNFTQNKRLEEDAKQAFSNAKLETFLKSIL